MRDEAAVPGSGGAAGSVVAERSGPDPLSRFRLDDRVALVAGGGGAIGSAIARAFAAAGARTVIVDQTDDRAEAAAELLRAAGSEVLALGADLTAEAECARVVAKAVERFGRLDIHANAVGGGAGKVLFDAEVYPRDAWDWIFELNLRSTLCATQAAVRAMIDAHDRMFGAGSGEAFLLGPYLDVLPSAVVYKNVPSASSRTIPASEPIAANTRFSRCGKNTSLPPPRRIFSSRARSCRRPIFS